VEKLFMDNADRGANAPMTAVTICLPASELFNIDSLASVDVVACTAVYATLKAALDTDPPRIPTPSST
jgi:hypothetical protein